MILLAYRVDGAADRSFCGPAAARKADYARGEQGEELTPAVVMCRCDRALSTFASSLDTAQARRWPEHDGAAVPGRSRWHG
jgi:hypothetical protein